jgi:heterodisulfide reductase subunit C
MTEVTWRLDEAQIHEWLQGLMEGDTAVIAPVEEDGVLLFKELREAGDAVLAPSGKTRWSPKEFLFPRSESLYSFAFAGGGVRVEDPPEPVKDQLMVGVRPCDAAGVARLDDVFMAGTIDPQYSARRERTTIVSAACAAADPECFCTAVGGSPTGTEGSDLQLIPLPDGWLLRPLTEGGEKLVAAHRDGWSEASEAELAAASEVEQKTAAQIETGPILREWSEALERHFDDPVWDRLTRRCLECSVCAYVCPSCSCFDMNQVGTAWGGTQHRSWDACTFDLFTRHASGHNPRNTKGQRYRQRTLHKFAFQSGGEDEPFRCVGCGRCIALCPAGIDIVETVREVVQSTGGDTDGVGA